MKGLIDGSTAALSNSNCDTYAILSRDLPTNSSYISQSSTSATSTCSFARPLSSPYLSKLKVGDNISFVAGFNIWKDI